MKKVMLCGVTADFNLGLPSMLHGIGTLLNSSEYQVINIQTTQIDPKVAAELPFETMYVPYDAKKLYGLAVLRKCGVTLQKESTEAKLLSLIAEMDMIIDVFGICFCDNFARPGKVSYLRCWRDTMGRFLIPYCGKLFGKKTLKNTSTYGPMKSEYSMQCAKLAERNIFDCFIARERESQKDFMAVSKTKKPVYLSPDVANFMPVPEVEKNNSVVVAMSHQIIKQWKGEETYFDVMRALCKSIYDVSGCVLRLLPNEVEDGFYNDLDVARDLVSLMQADGVPVEIIEAKGMTSMEVKAEIAKATAVISPRYHTCVAALTSEIPLMVIGWHNKYQELMCYYHQEQWILNTENCTKESATTLFADFWDHRKEIQTEIIVQKPLVKQQVRNVFFKALEELDAR